MKYIFGAVGLVVGYVISYLFFNFLESLEYGRVTSAVLFDDYGMAIIVGTVAIGLVSMGVGHFLEQKKKNNK